jgi:hypothetical protein
MGLHVEVRTKGKESLQRGLGIFAHCFAKKTLPLSPQVTDVYGRNIQEFSSLGNEVTHRGIAEPLGCGAASHQVPKSDFPFNSQGRGRKLRTQLPVTSLDLSSPAWWITCYSTGTEDVTNGGSFSI